MQFQKEKTNQTENTSNKTNPKSYSTNRSLKIEACDSDSKLPVIQNNEIILSKKIIEAKYSDSRSDYNKRSTDSSCHRNKSDEAFNSQTSYASAQKTSTKRINESQMNVLNKVKQPIVDIFFHGSSNKTNLKIVKANGHRSLSKVQVKSYK